MCRKKSERPIPWISHHTHAHFKEYPKEDPIIKVTILVRVVTLITALIYVDLTWVCYKITPMDVVSVIKDFDEFLSSKKASFSGVVIGAGALALMGITTRGTKNIDILDPMLPEAMLLLAREFAQKQSKSKVAVLRDDWLNNGPRSLIDNLPKGWLERSQQIFSGKALTLFALGRPDFLKSKLFAYCDRVQDIADCIKMNPSQVELLETLDWVKSQDQNPQWPLTFNNVLRS